MLKTLRAVAIAAAAGTTILAATPASAASTIQICDSPGCVSPDSNVLFQASTTGNPIFATLNDDKTASVKFIGTEDLNGIQSQGQARISAVDGSLNFLSILFDPIKAYNEIEFNLNAIGAGSTLLQFYDVAGNLLGSATYDLKGGGQNFFAAFDAPIGRTDITVTGTSLEDVRQIRLTVGTAVAAVPEPATWGLMLLGFGAMGYSMRRRKQAKALLQLA
jgi:hypothetical protein